MALLVHGRLKAGSMIYSEMFLALVLYDSGDRAMFTGLRFSSIFECVGEVPVLICACSTF